MVNAGYVWRDGFPVRAASAEAFAVQLRGLQVNGLIAVEDVLEAQRPEGAPLHGEIDWDDQSAAQKFRLGFVRDAMGALRVIPVDVIKEELSAPVRAVLPVRITGPDGNSGNVYAFVVNSDQSGTDELAARVRSEALGQVRRLAQRFVSIPGCEDIAERLLSICDLY